METLRGRLSSLWGELWVDGPLGEGAQFVVGHARIVLELVPGEYQAQVCVQVDLTGTRTRKPANGGAKLHVVVCLYIHGMSHVYIRCVTEMFELNLNNLLYIY